MMDLATDTPATNAPDPSAIAPDELARMVSTAGCRRQVKWVPSPS